MCVNPCYGGAIGLSDSQVTGLLILPGHSGELFQYNGSHSSDRGVTIYSGRSRILKRVFQYPQVVAKAGER